MSRLLRGQMRDEVTVSTYTGESSTGASFADPVTVLCLVDATRQLVRSSDGDEVVSELTVISHPRPRDEETGDLLDAEALFTPESVVEYRGRRSSVVGVKAHTDRGRLAHVEVNVR